MSCRPIGRPFFATPQGTDAAGSPYALNGRVLRANRATPASSSRVSAISTGNRGTVGVRQGLVDRRLHDWLHTSRGYRPLAAAVFPAYRASNLLLDRSVASWDRRGQRIPLVFLLDQPAQPRNQG